MARPTATRGCRSCRCRSTPRTARTRRWSSAARRAWDAALALGEQHGFRNAQVTVIAPTGTIGLVMDCDTTGIEPDFALVKFKKLAGGGYFKIINRMRADALARSATTPDEIEDITRYAVGHGTLEGCAGASITSTLKAKGFTDGAIDSARAGAGRGLRHQVRLQQMDARARSSAKPRSASPPSSSTIPASTCWRRWASPRPRSRPPTPTAAAP